VDEFLLYSISVVIVLIPWLFFWRLSLLTTLRMIIFLFATDTILTIEAAFYSDIVLIAFLHVVTIPAFFVLIYLDLVKEHRTHFECFICGGRIENQEEEEIIQRKVQGTETNFVVHKSCIHLEHKDKKRIRASVFRKGIPP
jgi:hypothetical protein